MNWPSHDAGALPPRSLHTATENYYHPWERFPGRPLHPHCEYKQEALRYAPFTWTSEFYRIWGDVGVFGDYLEKFGGWEVGGEWFMFTDHLFEMLDALEATR